MGLLAVMVSVAMVRRRRGTERCLSRAVRSQDMSHSPPMTSRIIAMLLVAALLSACASCSGRSDEECYEIAATIRDAAAKRTAPISYRGICSSADPAIAKDLGSACAKLRECQGRFDSRAGTDL